MSELTILPLGGYGEFGRNATLIAAGDLDRAPCVVVDIGAGMGQEQSGSGLLLPDLDLIAALGDRLQGYLLSHGHEDHIAGLPHALLRRPAPIYASGYCLAQLAGRLDNTGRTVGLHRLEPGMELVIGPFTVLPIAVSHSVPGTLALMLRHGDQKLLLSSDFRIDEASRCGWATDLESLRRIGARGVDLLLADSTGATMPGTNPGEQAVGAALEDTLEGAPGRVVVTTFPSHVQRLGILLELALRHGRRVAMLGRSAEQNFDLACRQGVLSHRATQILSPAQADRVPASQLLLVAGGSQGEPVGALARLAREAPGMPRLSRGDRVLYSARVIPGNERRVLRLANAFCRRGVELVWPERGIHVSGHGYQEDLRTLITAVQPRLLVPQHGDRLHLEALARLGVGAGLAEEQVAVVENGQPLRLTGAGESARLERLADHPLTTFEAQDMGAHPVDPDRVATRRIAGNSGVLGVVIELTATGELAREPVMRPRGVSPELLAVIDEVAHEIVTSLRTREAGEPAPAAVELAALQAVRRVLRRRGLRAPLTIPVAIGPAT